MIFNKTPLHSAAYDDSLDAVNLLLQQPKIDVNIKDNDFNKKNFFLIWSPFKLLTLFTTSFCSS